MTTDKTRVYADIERQVSAFGPKAVEKWEALRAHMETRPAGEVVQVAGVIAAAFGWFAQRLEGATHPPKQNQ